ncbi:MAG: hypothetical protein K6E57_09475 [Fibrobacter sp.]|nr:hypothetical protein [Fibrobacter sp.]
MTLLFHALACLMALGLAGFLWRGRISLFKESLLMIGFLLVFGVYTFLAGNVADPTMEHYPFRMLALCLCFSTTALPHKRRRYLVLAQAMWLWVEFFGALVLFYRGFDVPWVRIASIFVVGFGSSFLSRINREMEFCLMVFWIAIWVFF